MELFAGRENVPIDAVFHVEMRQDEKLWVALREVFISAQDLDLLAIRFALHVADLASYGIESVTKALTYGLLAAIGEFDSIPEDPRQDHWKEGATESERRAALSALWAATARSNAETDKEARIAAWDKERDWQIEQTKERANADR